MDPKFKAIDHGWEKLVKSMRKYANGKAAIVRAHGPNAENAATHEFGTRDGRIPERSFFRRTFDDKMQGYQVEISKIASKFFGNETIEGSLFFLGEQYRSDILDLVRQGQVTPGLSDSTLEQRSGGRSTPLWDTGEMMGSLQTIILDRSKVKND